MPIKSKVRTIPDFPQKGIMFRDVTTLIKDAEGFKEVIDKFIERYRDYDFDYIMGMEARGFIIGGALAFALGKGFIPVRKPGKLPSESISHEYELEYGKSTLEIHTDAIKKGDRVLLIDDLLATGGTALAGAKLAEQLGGEVVEMAFIIDLPDVGGRKRLADEGYKVFYLIEFEGD
ncbi:MAG TPA: adenine phosphoribosyltransferase [Spirochaetota bacterium]|nr:adenine phosphoribosyltransferase [Spirochaetota bacterium]HPJ34990.1 adenine phosphoribosyltransferase [Spirochaetota bacterium]